MLGSWVNRSIGLPGIASKRMNTMTVTIKSVIRPWMSLRTMYHASAATAATPWSDLSMLRCLLY